MKKKIFAANWKMNKTPNEATSFCEELKKINTSQLAEKDFFIFPQNFSLSSVASVCKGTPIYFGPQQIHTEKNGAFTGENSLDLALSLGINTCLIGHSERRQLFSETNQIINKKIQLCQDKNVLPVLCIGEQLEERQSGQTESVCEMQLSEGLVNIDKSKKIIIAYEPVWAIGTGQVATPIQVKEVHQFIQDIMNQWGFKDFSLLYGGSVKPDNAAELISIPFVDGFLIGGASLDITSFLKISSV